MGSQYDARLEMYQAGMPLHLLATTKRLVAGVDRPECHTTGGYTNVTALVTSLVTNNQLNFVANNAAPWAAIQPMAL